MPRLLERRRKPRRKAAQVTGPIWVMLESVPGARADVRAKLVDFNETGIRIHVSLLLEANHTVVVKCQAAGVVPNGKANARVVDCRALAGSGYSVGLTFEKTSEQLEKSKRRGLLELLYTARRNQPSHAAVSIDKLEELLGCPRGHLDFSLWYLEENALVTISETGSYSITAKGVDQLEIEGLI